MRYIVIRSHLLNEINRIELKKGDRVVRAEEYIGNPIWKNWVYCISQDTLQEGWIPRLYLEDLGEESILTEDYSSRELPASPGDLLQCRRMVNQWGYCRRLGDGTEGWIPLDCLEPLPEE